MENTVKISKRVIAYLLDILLIYILISAIVSIRFINPTYDKYVEAYEKYAEVLEDYTKGNITDKEYTELNMDNIINVTKYSISSNVVIILVIIGYFCLFQKFNNGQTLGKKIMKIKVVGVDNKNVNIGRYLLRILPMHYIFIGSILPILINSIFIFVLKKNAYIMLNSITIYIIFFISIISFVMMNIRKDKRGIQDLITNTKVVEE